MAILGGLASGQPDFLVLCDVQSRPLLVEKVGRCCLFSAALIFNRHVRVPTRKPNPAPIDQVGGTAGRENRRCVDLCLKLWPSKVP